MSENALGKANSDSSGEDKDSSVPVYRREHWLRKKYCDEMLTIKEISDEVNTSKQTIHKWLNKNDIETRGDHVRTHVISNGDKDEAQKYKTKEWLREQYVSQNKSMSEIAEMIDVSMNTVCGWLHKAGIDTREGGCSDKVIEQLRIEQLANKSWLYEKYIEEDMTMAEISEIVGCSIPSVSNWLHRHNIETREPSEYALSGEEHPNWKGGVDADYGKYWRKKRAQAIQRDNEQCRRCGKTRQQEREETGKDLHVHHIKKMREFDNSKNAHKLTNLITLCYECHNQMEGLPIDTR